MMPAPLSQDVESLILDATLHVGVLLPREDTCSELPATILVRHARGGWTQHWSIPSGVSVPLKSLPVPAGQFLVRVVLPSNEVLQQTGEILPGQTREVRLKESAAPDAGPMGDAGHLPAREFIDLKRELPVGGGLSGGSLLSGVTASFRAEQAGGFPWRIPVPIELQYWHWSGGEWRTEGPPVPAEIREKEPVILPVFPEGTRLVEIRGTADGYSEFRRIPPLWNRRDFSPAPAVLIFDSVSGTPGNPLPGAWIPRVELSPQDPDLVRLTGYLRQGRQGVAARMAGSLLTDTETFLLHKLRNPALAAAAALTLLKVRRLEQLHDWTYNLASNFDLPDGPVVRAWHLFFDPQAVRMSPADTPEFWLLEAVRRGLPLFSQSLRLLVDGLQFLHSAGTDTNQEAISSALGRCQLYLRAGDADEVFTSFRGSAPDHPRVPLPRSAAEVKARTAEARSKGIPRPGKSRNRAGGAAAGFPSILSPLRSITLYPKPMNKRYLHSLLRDKATMEEMANQSGMLESLNESVDNGQLQRLLGQDESVITDGPLTQAEAIILERGRPPLLIQDGKWQEPTLQELRNWINPAKDALLASIPKVGRVEILNYATDFVGTGWMIAEDLLITNRHVADLFGRQQGQGFKFREGDFGGAMQVQVDFLREYDRSATASFQVEEIIYIEENNEARPDMALVRLNKSAGSLPAPLDLDTQLISRDQPVAVIGYPAEDSRNDTFVMRDVFQGIFNVKRLSPGKITGVRPDGKLLEHDSSTLGGGSGAAVVSLVSGRVCGLHFGGRYKISNFCVSAAWLRSRLAELEPLRISGLRGRLEARTAQNAAPPAPVPAPETGAGGGGGTPGPAAAMLEAFLPEAVPNVEAGRTGYVPAFLGEGDLEVALPVLGTALETRIAPVKNRTDGLLHYTHFSILMSQSRRLPFFTAVNIDGGQLYNFIRGNDRWFFDPRLVDQKHQIGDELYKHNDLDRGHLVRRLDPAWGATREEAKQAEEDTFFFTNCSPQHLALNQQTWLSLEDYVLRNAATHRLKVTVFSGPVLDDANDGAYRGVQIPSEFWKVVVIVNAFTGKLSATGYLLSQKDYLKDLEEARTQEFVYGAFKTYQVPLTTIESLTGLSFNLSSFDPLANIESLPGRTVLEAGDLVL